MRQVEVTTWYLEQCDPGELRPAAVPTPEAPIIRAEVPSPELSRFLYTAVGGDHHWTERLGWTREEWANWLDRPGVETWIAYHRGNPAGYIEFDPQPEGMVEIVCFGLLPDFIGRGLGGHLLSYGMARAWDLDTRWPDREPTRRVWLHTCSLDGPAALANYQKRGMRLYDTTVTVQSVPLTKPAWR